MVTSFGQKRIAERFGQKRADAIVIRRHNLEAHVIAPGAVHAEQITRRKHDILCKRVVRYLGSVSPTGQASPHEQAGVWSSQGSRPASCKRRNARWRA